MLTEIIEIEANPAKNVVRPIQYLGSKLRSLGEIGKATDSLKHKPQRVLDLFSGSSVVSQFYRNRGCVVHANDAMKFCAVISNAIIGDSKRKNSLADLEAYVLGNIEGDDLFKIFKNEISKERNAISNSDPDILINMYHSLPQTWREGTIVVDGLDKIFEELKKCEERSGFGQLGIISFFYACTYFGIEQAVSIDLIRKKINLLFISDFITDWEKDLLLSALIGAMSVCVFSAGKHFAQPHLIRSDKDLTFVKKRILKDRSLNIIDLMRIQLRSFWNCSVRHEINGSRAYNKKVSDILNASPEGYDLIYADPPYTAQQYSRFYHIPEALMEYKIPELQIVNGEVTRGIYSEDKYKSPYCSKSQSENAFRDIFKLAEANSSSLILSYSLSKNETGNERMISFEKLIELSIDYVGSQNVKVVELEHVYRQFNKSEFIKTLKEDKEIQIVCEVKKC